MATEATNSDQAADRLDQEVSSALVRMEEQGEIVQWLNDDTNIFCSLPPGHPQYDDMMLATLGLPDGSIETVAGKTLDIVATTCHTVSYLDKETGELIPRPRFVMLLANGETISTSGAPSTRVLRHAIKGRGPGPWSPPIRLKCVKVPLDDRRRTFILVKPKPGE